MKAITLILVFFSCFNLKGQEPTWTADIASIIYENCSSCHHENAIAPFTLMSYQDAKDHAQRIRLEVFEKGMPPWPADPEFMHFVGEATLEQEQIDAIYDWVSNGMPYGNADEEPDPPVFLDNGSLLESIDHTISIEPYAVQTNEDEYRWFVIQNPFDETVYISKLEVLVGLDNLVHHADLFLDLSGSSLQNDLADPLPGFNNSTGSPNNDFYINAWQPGGNISKYPTGWGVAVPPEADFVIEIHYGPGGIGLIDSTKMNLQFVTESEYKRSIKTAWLLYDTAPVLTDGPLVIPANELKTFHQESNPLTNSLSFISICPHMHLLGKSYKVWYETPQGDSINFIDIPQWDFHWQKYYTFQSIQKIPAGSIIKSEGVYDNTINNHDNPNSPPQTVSKGLFTTDEMFLCYFIYSDYHEGDENIILDPLLEQTITSNVEEINFRLSPNPTEAQIFLEIEDKWHSKLKLSIYDAQDKLVYVDNPRDYAKGIDVSFFKEGIYFVELSNKTHSTINRFVKI